MNGTVETANHAVETFVLNAATVWYCTYFFFAIVEWWQDRPMIGRDRYGYPRAVRAIR